MLSTTCLKLSPNGIASAISHKLTTKLVVCRSAKVIAIALTVKFTRALRECNQAREGVVRFCLGDFHDITSKEEIVIFGLKLADQRPSNVLILLTEVGKGRLAFNSLNERCFATVSRRETLTTLVLLSSPSVIGIPGERLRLRKQQTVHLHLFRSG